jgi:hypothetical protein
MLHREQVFVAVVREVERENAALVVETIQARFGVA